MSVNKELVLGLIRHSSTGISRAQIARSLQLSRSTVSTIVDEFIGAGVVLERGVGESRGGRRPIVLEIRPDAGRVVGIDIGATHVLVAVADFTGRVLVEAEAPLAIASGPTVCLEQVAALVETTLPRTGCTMQTVNAIAIGVPGPVDIHRGMVSAPPIMPGWDGFPILRTLQEKWDKPMTLDNDADLGALGEWAFGAAEREQYLAYIKIGTGVGCGILIDGAIYHGVLGTAGEIGHFTISDAGPPCTCGNYGCLEAMAGGRAIAQRAQLAIAAGQRTALAEIENGITARDVARAADAGDVVSQQLLGDAGRLIGSAIASLINLLNPGLVLVGGGVADAGRYLWDPILATVEERSLKASLRAARVGRGALGRRSTALGAVSLALTKAFLPYC